MPASDLTNPRVRVEAEGTSIDQAVHLFRATYNGGAPWEVSTTDQDFSFRHTALGDGDMTLRNTRFLGQIAGEMNPEDDYVLSWITGGHGGFDTARSSTTLVLGQPFMFPTDRPVSFDMADVEQKLVHFHKPFLERIAAEHHGAAPGTLHLDTTRTPADAAIRSWRNTLALVSRMVADPDASPILQAEMGRIAALATLGMFPPQTLDLPAGLLQPGNARIRAAVEYIHANCHLPISTTMIAAAADLSLRALQEGFQRLLDVTPNGYLRDVRLDRVRQELQSGSSNNVADTARAWGFGHPGRFTAAYAKRFAEHPHNTRP
ncbi:helix-turn-helix transcriptional regulator [Frondihabitans sp. PhB188]|uniref:helix-turn-helix transcriptional regulator n=1 Tax=Frondihabitans sp. PhB188 TaxID=2485200 RepID=UPI0013154508|nr:helix-turn-helix transcriptional regulator [Frondihabitans sp. PhB188]